jgi:hypothetical protein
MNGEATLSPANGGGPGGGNGAAGNASGADGANGGSTTSAAGGGGGVGRIFLRTRGAPATNNGLVTPPATVTTNL